MSAYKYPWHQAPEWAMAAVTHPNGFASWFGVYVESGLHFQHCWDLIGAPFDASDWENSIEYRPAEFGGQGNPKLRQIGISVLSGGPVVDSRNSLLNSAAPDLLAEMQRYLPVLERLEAEPDLWERFTSGLGIATLNGYRKAIEKAIVSE